MSKKGNYAWPVTSINREDMIVFDEWFEKNKHSISDKTIVIWGAGIRGTEFKILFDRKGMCNIQFTDINSQKWGGDINGTPIIPLENAYSLVESKKAVILISTENSESIESELLSRDYVEGRDFFCVKSNLYSLYVKEFQRTYSGDVLIMGDCEFTKISLHDNNILNLSEMLKEKIGENKCKVLAMHGMGLRSHYNVLKMQIKSGLIPKILVIMINLDTLTGKQHLLPRSQHEELLLSIYKLQPNGDEEFKDYLQEVHVRTKNIQVEFKTEKKKTEDEQLQDLKARNYFKVNYLYKLDLQNEGIQYLKKILEIAQKNNVKVIPFIPPVNYEYGTKLFGNYFVEKYEENVNKILMFVAQFNCSLLDLSFELTSQMFAETNTPDETANEYGRQLITEQILKKIEEFEDEEKCN